MIATLLAALGLGLPMAPSGTAQVLVLTTESAPDQSGFVEALRIQLAGTGSVATGPKVTGATLTARVEHAAHAVDAAGASLAVWVERGPSTDGERVDFILYVVGSKSGRALVEVFRLPARDAPETDRALALKVRDTLDALLIAPADESSTTPAEWIGHEPTRAKKRRRARLLLQLGARVTPSVGTPESQGGALLAAGARLELGAADLDLYLAAWLSGGLDQANRAGRVQAEELPVALGGRALLNLGRFSADARVELGARFVDAHGVTPFGAEGDASVVVPSALAAVGAGFPLRPGVEARAAAGIEVSPWRQTLTVNEIPVLDLGRARPVIQFSVVVLIP